MPDTPTPEIDADLLAFLTSELARCTKMDEADLSVTSTFVDIGLQSIDAVIISGNLEDRFGIEIDPELIFEHATVESYAAEISALIRSQ